MNAALMYCNKKFKKSHATTRGNKAIYASFEALDIEIKKLKLIDQINLYSATTQFLESLLEDPRDSINPLEVFILRCDSIVGKNNGVGKKIGLALGVIALSIAVVALGGALGLGIGMMLGLWQTPLVFLPALLAAETAPLIVASTSITAGFGTGLVSQFLFFREPKIKTSLDHCVETIKQSHLTETQPIDDDLETYPMQGTETTYPTPTI